MDTEFASLREKERLARLEEQISDMLSDNVNYQKLIEEIDYHTFSDSKLETVPVLLKIRERQGMVILKPGKA